MSTKTAFRLLALLFGFLQAWAHRFYIEPDGVNYLDIAHAYLRRDWTNALNAYWSPLYSWLLALIQWVFHPSPYFESTSLHLLNFVLFLLALASFEFFFSRLLLLVRDSKPPAPDSAGMPEWAWWTLGYTAFLVCTLGLITLRNDTPDMALASVLFLATGILVDLAQPNHSMLSYASLGLILGVAYLAKSVILPLSLVYILAAAFASGGFKKPDLRALVVLAGFLLVSTPFAIVLSCAKGRPTFGDTGKVAYVEEVLRIPIIGAGAPQLAHRPVKLFDNPPVYAYATPFTSTYSAWYDPSYWFEDFHPHFVLRDQWRALARALAGYFAILSTAKHWIAGWLVLAFAAGDWRRLSVHVCRTWFVWLPSVAALALYALVLVEPRYVAVGLTVVCLTLFAAVRWSQVHGARNLGVAVVFAVCTTSGFAIAKDALMNLALCVRPPHHVQWQVAEGLLKMGLSPGDQVAVLGHTTVADYWAHLGGFRVIADIPLEAEQPYWLATPGTRQQIASRLHAYGIRALVTARSPLVSASWRAIGDTGYYVEVLDPVLGAGSTSVGAAP